MKTLLTVTITFAYLCVWLHTRITLTVGQQRDMMGVQESDHPKSNSAVHFIDGMLGLTVIASAARSCRNRTELPEDYSSILRLFCRIHSQFLSSLTSILRRQVANNAGAMKHRQPGQGTRKLNRYTED